MEAIEACARTVYTRMSMVRYNPVYMRMYMALRADVRRRPVGRVNRAKIARRSDLESSSAVHVTATVTSQFGFVTSHFWSVTSHSWGVTSRFWTVTSQVDSNDKRTYAVLRGLPTRFLYPRAGAGARTHAQEEKRRTWKVVGT
jgi:hypothetical protein